MSLFLVLFMSNLFSNLIKIVVITFFIISCKSPLDSSDKNVQRISSDMIKEFNLYQFNYQQYDLKNIENKTSNYEYSAIKGKKIVCLGDSITWGAVEDLIQAENPYPKVIAETFGVTTINAGINGDTLSWNSITGGMWGRTQTIDFTDVDYLLIFGGTNDQQNNVTVDDYTEYSAVGALRSMVNYMRINHPKVKVVVILPIHKDCIYEDISPTLNRLVEAMKKYCTESCVPMIDLYNKFFLDFRNFQIREIYAADCVHPNQNGYILLGEYIGSKLAYNNFD